MKQATIDDKQFVIKALSAAFQSNLSVNYLIPQLVDKEKRIKALTDYSFEICRLFGKIYVSNNDRACALVNFPERTKTTLKSLLLEIELIFNSIGVGNIKKAIQREKAISKHYPKEGIYYLWFIGVLPEFQGRGIGEKLMREILADADQMGRVRNMFGKMKNIDTAFRHVRAFTMVVIVGRVAVSSFAIYKSQQLVSRMQSKIYILANGKALEAYASERKDNIPVEARDHVGAFHLLFFTLDPDDKAIKANITKVLRLADESAKRVYDALKENGFYSGIISGHINQTIRVDSLAVDVNEYPYRFRCYATQNIVRPTSIRPGA